MASVYNIAKFDGSKPYVKNDIVLYDTDETNTGRTENHHWYATKDVPAGSTPSPTSDYWAGRVLDNGIQKPKFLWTPSYASSADFNPTVTISRFGDGYEQRVATNINNNFLKLSLKFDLRGKMEATAILHFLNQRRAVEAFVFDAPEPFGTAGGYQYFVCRSWNNSFSFYENFSIGAQFEQVAA